MKAIGYCACSSPQIDSASQDLAQGARKDDEWQVKSSSQKEMEVGSVQTDANPRARGDKRWEGNNVTLGITLNSGKIDPEFSAMMNIDIEGMGYLMLVTKVSNSNLGDTGTRGS